MKLYYFSLLMFAAVFSIKAQTKNTSGKITFDKQKKINVAYFIFDQVEALDLNGPLDVMEKANSMDPVYNIYTVSITDKMIESEGNPFQMKAKYTIENAPQADIIIFPGAMPDNIAKMCKDHPELIDWIKEQDKKTKLTMSVCLGAFFLADTGLLDGKKATTHFEFLDALKKYPDITVISDKRFVQDGKILTTAGITSGIDGALYVVEMINGKKIADKIAEILVYNRNGNMDFMSKK